MANSGCEKPKWGQLWYQTRGLSSEVHKPMADMMDLNLRITKSVLVFQHLLSISYINRSCFIIVAKHFSNNSVSDGFMTGLKICDKPDIKMCHLNLMTSFPLRLKKKVHHVAGRTSLSLISCVWIRPPGWTRPFPPDPFSKFALDAACGSLCQHADAMNVWFMLDPMWTGAEVLGFLGSL